MSEEGIPQMRERINELEKQLKAAQDEAAKANSRARLFEAKDVFREQGYNPIHAELFVQGQPEGDITPESVDAFAQKYGLAPTGEGEGSQSSGTEGEDSEREDSAPPSDTGLSSFGRAGSGSGDGGSAPATTEKLTHEEWKELHQKDPARARKAVADGRVEFKEGNFYATQFNR